MWIRSCSLKIFFPRFLFCCSCNWGWICWRYCIPCSWRCRWCLLYMTAVLFLKLYLILRGTVDNAVGAGLLCGFLCHTSDLKICLIFASTLGPAWINKIRKSSDIERENSEKWWNWLKLSPKLVWIVVFKSIHIFSNVYVFERFFGIECTKLCRIDIQFVLFCLFVFLFVFFCGFRFLWFCFW